MKSVLFPILSLAGFCLTAAGSSDPFTPPNFPTPNFPTREYNVMDYGATAGGVTNDTPAINQAIEKCNADGGGTVKFPAGKYLAASIHLKSNVRLLLDDNAVITGARDGYDAPEPNEFSKYQDFGHGHFHDALMWGENLENFAIVGGKINGGAIGHGDPKPGGVGGDKLIAIRTGKCLMFKGVTHEKGGHFVYLLNDCRDVTLQDVVIKESRDGVDLMGCSDVQVTGCHFTGCGDDTLGFKSDYALGRKIDSENLYAWDCYFESGCNGVQFGSETAGDFHNVNVWNIHIGRAMKAGIGITSNDGGIIDGANYRDITIKGAASPIYILLTARLRSGVPGVKVGAIRNVKMSNITVTDCQAGRQGPVLTSTISGRPDGQIENLTFDNVSITYPGGGNAADADIVPPYPKDYSPRSLGPRPAAGFYIRHVKNLTFHNVQVTFEAPDQRPTIVANDVDGFTLDGFKAQKPDGVDMLHFKDVRNFTVHNSPGLADRDSEPVAKERE
jgi:polygalacturonase